MKLCSITKCARRLVTFLCLGVYLAGLIVLTGGRASAADDHDQLVGEARAALSRAARYFHDEIACHGGYLWRYKEDLSEREGEDPATASQIWVQPPGTPAVGMAFLSAYEATGSPFLLQAARDAAGALIWGQLACGGWHYKIDFDPEESQRWYYRRDKEAGVEQAAGQQNQGTFDDNMSQHALRLLMTVDHALNFKDEDLHHATLYGLQFVLNAQFPNGAWPQRWPLWPEHFSAYYTFNDKAINDCITVMLQAYIIYGDERYFTAAKKGGDFIILSQLPKPQAGWAQQYDWDMRPAGARVFEPPACNGSVTVSNIATLVTLYRATEDGRYLAPIPAAIEWLQASRLGNGRWARFYELETNRPLYVTKDDEVVYVYDDRTRAGYAWQGDYGIERMITEYEALNEDIAAGKVQWTISPPSPESRTAQELRAALDRLAPAAREAIDSLDERGRWVRKNGWIYCRDFNTKMGRLSRYLAAARELKSAPGGQ